MNLSLDGRAEETFMLYFHIVLRLHKPYTIRAYVSWRWRERERERERQQKRLLARWLPHEYLALFFPSENLRVPPPLFPSLPHSSNKGTEREGVRKQDKVRERERGRDGSEAITFEYRCHFDGTSSSNISSYFATDITICHKKKNHFMQ